MERFIKGFPRRVLIQHRYGSRQETVSDRKNIKCTILSSIVIMRKFRECRSQGMRIKMEFNNRAIKKN